MSEDGTATADTRDSLSLKPPEPDVSAEDPWHDDVLNRAQVAARLTTIVRNQTAPFVLSVHGHWGTGKTFLLQRWQADLQQQDFNAIYFNAWEDDFCDDPLLAILGQLSAYFKASGFKAIAGRVAQTAVPLLRQNVVGVLSKQVGITLQVEPKGPDQGNLLDAYAAQRASKDELKKSLQELSSEVHGETGHPMVFIIDELDRCRPTFAIELLERVKHIFDVPHMVFVFGVNRTELCSALQSVYGDIDAEVYLRRFFDMELTLSEVEPEDFCKHMIDRYGLTEFFAELGKEGNATLHAEELDAFTTVFPLICDRLGLSLRDIDYCVRLVALLGKSIEARHYMYPVLLAPLVALKLGNIALYRQFISGKCHGSDVMNYIDAASSGEGEAGDISRVLDMVECHLYMADRQEVDDRTPAFAQLQLLRDGLELTEPEYVSERTKTSDPERIGNLMSLIKYEAQMGRPRPFVARLAELIDLHQREMPR